MFGGIGAFLVLTVHVDSETFPYLFHHTIKVQNLSEIGHLSILGQVFDNIRQARIHTVHVDSMALNVELIPHLTPTQAYPYL